MVRFGSLPLMLITAVAFVPTASAGVLSGVERRAGSGDGIEQIVLSFEGAVPDLSVEVGSKSVLVRMPGTSAQASEHNGLRVSQSTGEARVELLRSDPTLLALRLEDAVAVLEVAYPANEHGPDDYRLGVGDVVTILVYREPDSSGDFLIAQDGAVSVPPASPVRAVGLTESELAMQIRRQLSEYLVDPQVSVSVKVYASQFVIVTAPGGRGSRVALKPGMSIKDVLSEAGVALGPGQQVSLLRAGASVSLDPAALDAGDAPRPRDGDVLTLIEEHIFVRGEVNRPGRFTYTPGMTLQQALAIAEGLTDWANRKEIRIQRKAGEAAVDESINLKKVEERRVPDPLLRPGDIVLVRRRAL